MYDLYKIIEDLCDSRGITVSQMSKDIDIHRNVMPRLKASEGKKSLSLKTLEKLSVYFNVPIDYFRDGTPIDADAPPEPPITDDQLMFALWGDVKDELTEDDLMEVRRYAEFVRQRKLDNKKGE